MFYVFPHRVIILSGKSGNLSLLLFLRAVLSGVLSLSCMFYIIYVYVFTVLRVSLRLRVLRFYSNQLDVPCIAAGTVIKSLYRTGLFVDNNTAPTPLQTPLYRRKLPFTAAFTAPCIHLPIPHPGYTPLYTPLYTRHTPLLLLDTLKLTLPP